MKQTKLLFILPSFYLILFAISVNAQPKPARSIDVLHYDAQVEPDIAGKSVKGKVMIRFASRVNNLTSMDFDRGELTIDSVRENKVAQNYTTSERRLKVTLSRPARLNERREIEVEYHGTPRRGIRFFPEQKQVYTVFTTNQWMVCVDVPDDKATLRLKLIVPSDLTAVANGRLAGRSRFSDSKVAQDWRQDIPVPSYVFGFAAGPYRTITEQHGRVQLRYLATKHSDEEIKRIFRETAGMIVFFEARAGVRYADSTYTQVLGAGSADQEMSGFTVLSESYGAEVLEDEKEIWLGAHELAHQWWGNMVTCVDWNHFWLNEGIATFIAAAYKEHRFGRQEYMREIELYRKRYEKVRDAGKDRSLVFPNWDRPTSEDRSLVYNKGAYVIHLLRQELGERRFWAAFRQYTRAYFGKSVTTRDFQTTMERASRRDLREFFSKWVYLDQR